MLISCTIKNGKIQEDISFLQDGIYLMKVIPFKDKTRKEYLEEYWAIVEEAAFHIGHSKYEMHSIIKKELQITSTKEIELEQWSKIIEETKFFLLNLNN